MRSQGSNYADNPKERELFRLNDFVFSDNVSNDNSKKLEMIEMTESVSVHIRRGDYVTNYSYIW